MEAAIRNGARRRVLALVNGAFSERFHRIATANDIEADTLDVGWGGVHTRGHGRRHAGRGQYDAVTVVHCETSTGVLNPIGELAEVASAPAMSSLLVDAVSSMAGARVETDEWGLDFVLTGSQKCFALPPGMAFGVANERILERAAEKPDRGLYFDLLAFEKNSAKNQTPYTPAVSLIYALAAQVEHVEREGIENRWARHQAMAERTWAWVDENARPRDRALDPRARGVPLAYRDLHPPARGVDRAAALRRAPGARLHRRARVWEDA